MTLNLPKIQFIQNGDGYEATLYYLGLIFSGLGASVSEAEQDLLTNLGVYLTASGY